MRGRGGWLLCSVSRPGTQSLRDRTLKPMIGDINSQQRVKFFLGWVGHFDLVWNTSQESAVNQILRLEVRREDNELIERNLNLLAAGKVEKVIPFFERYNPAIQQYVDRHGLATKIINHQGSTVAFELAEEIHRFSSVDSGQLPVRPWSIPPPAITVGRTMCTQR